jgi:uroporphyrinogen-III synthase
LLPVQYIGVQIIGRRFIDKSSVLKRVLITRPEPGASQTAARLTALGLMGVVAPVLSVTARPLDAPGRIAATILTSQNAVPSCPPSVHDRPVFAVGTATATMALKAGFKQVLDADGDAAALAKLVADTLDPADGALFLPTGSGQGADLAASLRQRGFRVFRRIAYHAASVPTLPDVAAIHLRQGGLVAAMFFSADTSHHFVRLLQAANLDESVRDVEAVSISERAAMPLRRLPWRRISVASKPNQDAMLALLK